MKRMVQSGALLVVLLMAGLASATTPGNEPEVRCQGGEAWACLSWGRDAQNAGDFAKAKAAFGRACELGNDESCLPLGQLLLTLSEFAKAEVPLRIACDAGSLDACKLLVRLYDERGKPGDKTDERLRRRQVALIEKPTSEFVAAFRPGLLTTHAFTLMYTFAPLALDRHLLFGAHAVINAGSRWEFNGVVGYQHYLGNLAPYVAAMVGALPAQGLFNIGGDLGLKWYPFGHTLSVQAMAGYSLGSSVHGGIGVGVDEAILDRL